MSLKKSLSLLMVCLVMVMCLVPVGAAISPDDAIYLEDLPSVKLDITLTEYLTAMRSTENLNVTIPANSGGSVGTSFSLEKNEIVTFNCSYTPSSASMQFGLIDSGGTFHYISVNTGNINRSIRITTRDEYTLAIWNDSDSTVSVTGYVSY